MTMRAKVRGANALKAATAVRQAVKTPLRAVPNSRQRVPAKPVAVSTSRHAAQTNPAAAKAAAQAAKLARRDRVVLEHVPLVKAIAVRVHETLPGHVDFSRGFCTQGLAGSPQSPAELRTRHKPGRIDY
jgi:hypothetical protein